jgi:hypothetical protein
MALCMPAQDGSVPATPQDGDPIEGVPAARGVAMKHEEGMRITPDVVLFGGAVVLTVVLTAVFVPFCVRIWREDSPGRRSRNGGER